MIPLAVLSRLPATCPRALTRGLLTSGALSKQCGHAKERDRGDLCKPQCPSTKKRKPKDCEPTPKTCEPQPKTCEPPPEDLPEHCSQEAAMECLRRIKELQAQWEQVAALAPKPQEKQQRERPSSCGVKPPRQEEEEGGNTLLYLGVAAVLAALGYWLYTNMAEEGGKEGGEKPEE